MAFWIKIFLLAAFAWAASAATRSEVLWNAYYGAFGTPDEQQLYMRDLALRHMIRDGDDARYVEFARTLP